jgi:hypothetical protein
MRTTLRAKVTIGSRLVASTAATVTSARSFHRSAWVGGMCRRHQIVPA